MNRKQRSRKQVRSGSKHRGHGRKHFSKRVQRGGVSPACVLDGATSTSLLVRNPDVNLHNTNPQASLDLDNKFMSYGGAVPLGSNILQGGASSKCGDEGVGTGYGKSETFKQYLEGLSNQYNIVGGGKSTKNEQNMDAMQLIQDITNTSTTPDLTSESTSEPTVGGGFTTDPSEYIAGLPVYKAYDDCCPPAIVGGDLKFGAPDQPVCGLGAIRGGGRAKNNRNKKSKKHSKRASKRSHKRVQRGGADWVYSKSSVPAPYADAFNGAPSVFKYPDDMMGRKFDETQPNYTPNAI